MLPLRVQGQDSKERGVPLLSLTSFIMKSNAFPESSRQISSQSYWLELVHMAHSSPLQQKMQGTQEEEAMTAHGHPRQYQDVHSREEAGSGCQVDNQPFLPQVAWPFTCGCSTCIYYFSWIPKSRPHCGFAQNLRAWRWAHPKESQKSLMHHPWSNDLSGEATLRAGRRLLELRRGSVTRVPERCKREEGWLIAELKLSISQMGKLRLLAGKSLVRSLPGDQWKTQG